MARYVRAYHFVGDALRDGRDVPADGEWLTHDGKCVICVSGLHASRHPLDALQYAPGPVLCLVDCGQIEHEQGDKFVCRKRRIVARFDATNMLREFARKCALDVIHLWGEPPDIVRRYLETGDESLRAAARAAAWAGARDAAWAAAWTAAWGGARDAAWGAAWDAAWAAATDAPWAAARAAAWAGARDAAWAGARDAAWAEATDAAWDAQRQRFAAIVDAEFAKIAEGR